LSINQVLFLCIIDIKLVNKRLVDAQLTISDWLLMWRKLNSDNCVTHYHGSAKWV